MSCKHCVTWSCSHAREALRKQNYDQGAHIVPTSRITTRELASWLAGWLGGLYTTRKCVLRLACWLVGWGSGWLWGGPGFPVDFCWAFCRTYWCMLWAQRSPERRGVDRTSLSCAWLEATRKQNYIRPGRLPTSRISTREAPLKQNYDQGAYPQAELRPGNWLAGWLAELRPGSLSCAWLAGWLGGWLAG